MLRSEAFLRRYGNVLEGLGVSDSVGVNSASDKTAPGEGVRAKLTWASPDPSRRSSKRGSCFSTPFCPAVLAGAVLGWLGIYVVLRKLVFLSAAISQAAGLGVASAFFVQIHLGVSASVASPLVGAGALTMLAVLPVATERGRRSARRDSILGFIFLLGAAGTLAVGARIVQEVQDIQSILFGSAVAVLPEDFRLVLVTAVALLALHIWWHRGFSAVSFDAAGARVRGLPVGILDLGLFLSLAVAISVSTRVLGALPTFAFSVLPAMAAVRWVPNVGWGLIVASVLGAAAGFCGYLIAFLYELPVGASQTLFAAATVALAEVAHVLRVRLVR